MAGRDKAAAGQGSLSSSPVGAQSLPIHCKPAWGRNTSPSEPVAGFHPSRMPTPLFTLSMLAVHMCPVAPTGTPLSAGRDRDIGGQEGAES